MNRKLTVIIIFFLIITLTLSGCTNKSNLFNFLSVSTDNYYPKAVIKAPKKAYFDDFIKFDATDSYDSDGRIISYQWIFGDGNTAEGEIVKHSYNFDNNLKINYPLIYTYSLLIVDNKGAKIVRNNEIMIFPNKYQLFLKSGFLDFVKPYLSEEFVKTSIGKKNYDSSRVLTYKLEESINVSACDWNISICLKKSLFTRLSKIRIELIDSNLKQISEAEKKLGLFRFWNKKNIELSGRIIKNSEFQFIKLYIYGFSIRNKIKILYGSEKASNVCFNFRN